MRASATLRGRSWANFGKTSFRTSLHPNASTTLDLYTRSLDFLALLSALTMLPIKSYSRSSSLFKQLQLQPLYVYKLSRRIQTQTTSQQSQIPQRRVESEVRDPGLLNRFYLRNRKAQTHPRSLHNSCITFFVYQLSHHPIPTMRKAKC
jgi:hypothetical protein